MKRDQQGSQDLSCGSQRRVHGDPKWYRGDQADRGPAYRELSDLTVKHINAEVAMKSQGLPIVNLNFDLSFCYQET